MKRRENACCLPQTNTVRILLSIKIRIKEEGVSTLKQQQGT